MSYQIVLARHGQSEWNKLDLFTGWVDVELSELGREEARLAGEALKKNNYHFTLAYTSVLKRAINTCDIILDVMDQKNISIKRDWRLNERHYGDLQGKNKQQTREQYGDEQVHIWRRSFDVPPPASKLEKADPAIYPGLINFPQGESLKMTCERVVPYWESEIKPHVARGEKIIIVAHGNSLRGLLKHLAKISDDKIVELNIPTGKPIVLNLKKDFTVESQFYLE